MNSSKKTFISKLIYILLFAGIQIAMIVLAFKFFWDIFPYFYILGVTVSVLSAAHVINSRINPAFKLAWLVPILAFPIFGGLFYLMFSPKRHGKKYLSVSSAVRSKCAEGSHPVPTATEAVSKDCEAMLQSRYISNASGCPPYANTETNYFPLGEDMFASMIKALKNAKRFIFLEYFIIQEGTVWDSVLEILEEKVAEGVEVRLMYDDLGCLFTLPSDYWKTMRDKGIKTIAFNPFSVVISPRFNNRDHRKLCIIDGTVGYTGGINLADEYINDYERFGHWKDTGIMLRGGAVWSMTVQYLALWDIHAGDQSDYDLYLPDLENCAALPENGFVQPFSDVPMDEELVGKTVYLNMISRAKRYVYITTPYLILDNEMLTALQTAAKSGIDVRIITPHIPDKKTIFYVTRSFYNVLLDSGVKIYEYTPGFIHAKMFVSDDKYACVGTINLDYRSLYLHFECAAWMCECSAVPEVRDDFLATQEKSEEILIENLKAPRLLYGLFLSVLRVLAPLM